MDEPSVIELQIALRCALVHDSTRVARTASEGFFEAPIFAHTEAHVRCALRPLHEASHAKQFETAKDIARGQGT
jgi:hypothetical protein